MTPRILKKTQPSFIVIITLGEKYRLGILTNGLIIHLFLSITLATGAYYLPEFWPSVAVVMDE